MFRLKKLILDNILFARRRQHNWLKEKKKGRRAAILRG